MTHALLTGERNQKKGRILKVKTIKTKKTTISKYDLTSKNNLIQKQDFCSWAQEDTETVVIHPWSIRVSLLS